MSQLALGADDWRMAHLMTLFSATLVFYAAVTRGALAFAWALGRVVRR